MRDHGWDLEGTRFGPVEERYRQPSLVNKPDAHAQLLAEAHDISERVDAFNHGDRVRPLLVALSVLCGRLGCTRPLSATLSTSRDRSSAQRLYVPIESHNERQAAAPSGVSGAAARGRGRPLHDGRLERRRVGPHAGTARRQAPAARARSRPARAGARVLRRARPLTPNPSRAHACQPARAAGHSGLAGLRQRARTGACAQRHGASAARAAL
jgi:hypothetical protein